MINLHDKGTIYRVYNKILYFICSFRSSSFVWYIRRMGCDIGEKTKFHGRKNIDLTRPYLITIGSDVTVTDDVLILTHGHDWSVLRNKYKDPMILGNGGAVTIGNNVFIGAKSIILKGVTIGDNVIVAAGSVVNRDIPSNVVAAGTPAKVVCDLDTYYESCKSRIQEDFIDVLHRLDAATDEINESMFWEFFPLFKRRSEALTNVHNNQLRNAKDSYMKSDPVWDGLDDALDHMRKKFNNV
jgi:acetyltransferase-like isoleucine patch superfamily enzyme